MLIGCNLAESYIKLTIGRTKTDELPVRVLTQTSHVPRQPPSVIWAGVTL